MIVLEAARIQAEMPTSGDLKLGDSLFFTSPPGNFNDPPPPRKIDPAQNGNDLGHYMTSYMKSSKVEALRGALGPTLGRGGKRKGRRACNYVESLEFELPLQ